MSGVGNIIFITSMDREGNGSPIRSCEVAKFRSCEVAKWHDYHLIVFLCLSVVIVSLDVMICTVDGL